MINIHKLHHKRLSNYFAVKSFFGFQIMTNRICFESGNKSSSFYIKYRLVKKIRSIQLARTLLYISLVGDIFYQYDMINVSPKT